MLKRLLDYCKKQDDGLYIGMHVKVSLGVGLYDAIVIEFDKSYVTVKIITTGFRMQIIRKKRKWYDGAVI